MSIARIGVSIKIIETKGPNTFKPLLSQRERRIQNIQATIIPQITPIQQHNNPIFPKIPHNNLNANNAFGTQENPSSNSLKHPLHTTTNNNSAIENEGDESEVFATETMENSPGEVVVPNPCEPSESTSQSLPNENNDNIAARDYESYSRPYREAIEYLKGRDTGSVPTTTINIELPMPEPAQVESVEDNASSKDKSFWGRHRVKILTGTALFITAAVVWYKKDAIVESGRKFFGYWFGEPNNTPTPQTPVVANVPNPTPKPQAPVVANIVNGQPSNMPADKTVKTFQSLIIIYKQRFPWTLENLKNSFKQYGKQLFIDLVDGKDITPSEKSKTYGAYMYMLGAGMLKKALETGLVQIANGSYVRGPKWDCCLDDFVKKI